MAGLEFATFHVGGITTATITWETLNDATSGWVALLLTNQTSGALSTTATADGIYAVNCARAESNPRAYQRLHQRHDLCTWEGCINACHRNQPRTFARLKASGTRA